MRALFSLGVLAYAVASATAASIIGTWHGSADVSAAKSPSWMDAKQYKTMIATAASIKVVLVFKPDKTFTSTLTSNGAPKPQTSRGTWSQTGSTIKIASGGSVRTLTLSSNGKKLVMIPDHGFGVKMIFKR
jgi:hypothetical protein